MHRSKYLKLSVVIQHYLLGKIPKFFLYTAMVLAILLFVSNFIFLFLLPPASDLLITYYDYFGLIIYIITFAVMHKKYNLPNDKIFVAFYLINAVGFFRILLLFFLFLLPLTIILLSIENIRIIYNIENIFSIIMSTLTWMVLIYTMYTGLKEYALQIK
jgi:hypothetical protein